MAIIAGTSMQSMLESIRRSLDSPTPDMQVTRIQFESLAKIADIYFDQYEEMVWANSQLREDLKFERQMNNLNDSFEARLQRLESYGLGNTAPSHSDTD